MPKPASFSRTSSPSSSSKPSSCLGGTIHERETKRYEIKHVPAVIRNRDREIGRGKPVLPALRAHHVRERPHQRPRQTSGRVCLPRPSAAGRDARPRHRAPPRPAETRCHSDRRHRRRRPARALLYLEHAIQDARTDRAGNRRVVSKRLQFVEVDQHGNTTNAGPAPYLDYRPLTDAEAAALQSIPSPDWLRQNLGIAGDGTRRHPPCSAALGRGAPSQGRD